MVSLDGKKVLITGGSSGIGAQLVEECVGRGAQVCFTYNTNKKSAQTLADKFDNVEALHMSLGPQESIQDAARQAKSSMGGIDVLINNAGRYIDGDEWDGEYKVWLQTLTENLLGTMELTKFVAKEFIKQKSGTIVTIASRLGVSGHYEELSYGAAKAGLINMTQAYAKLFSKFDGRAYVVSPSATKAGYWLRAPKEEVDSRVQNSPIGRLLSVDEVADVIINTLENEKLNIDNIRVGLPNYAFIDGQNLHKGVARLNWQLNYYKLRHYLLAKFNVQQAYIFLGYIKGNEKLYKYLEDCGFKLIFKKVSHDKSGGPKGNVDVDLTLYTMSCIDDFNKAVLITSDGDFAPLIKELSIRNKFKILISPERDKCSYLLRGVVGGRVSYLSDIKDKVCKVKSRPADR